MGQKLGQHFLTSTKALADIIAAAEIQPTDIIYEIGPGKGVLTERLVRGDVMPQKVIAVEKDSLLASFLTAQFSKEIFEGKVEIISGDLRDHLPESLGLQSGAFKVVANIPYYLTGLIFRKMLAGKVQPERAVFLIQKEVAERIARNEKESLASLSVKAYGTPRYVATVRAGSFSPPPNVDSAIISIENISRSNFRDEKEEAIFFELIKHAFASKRKMLAGNISYLGKERVFELMEKVGIDPKARAEDVALDTWLALTREVSA